MATTTNYGWTTPNDTDLVRDGASAIRSLGSAIDTTVYNNANAAVQKTLVDAKGDLVTATANDTPARLAVGNNGETLVADSSTTTGLRYSAGVGFTQPVINGGMDVWQRGTSFSITNTNAYTADRWNVQSAGPALTASRQTTSDSTNLPFIQYCVRVQRNSGQTSTSAIILQSMIETVNTIPFAGKTVTLSFYARKGADWSVASSNLTVKLFTGTGTDQSIITGSYTGQATPIDSTATLTTTWQRFTFTATLGSTVSEMATYFRGDGVGTAGTNDYFEITGVQIDAGSTALSFRRSGGTLAGELAACQRYYEKSYSQATAPGTASTPAGGRGFNASQIYADFLYTSFLVPKRTAPTVTLYSTNTGTSGKIYDSNAGLDINSAAGNIGETSFGQNATLVSGRAYAFHYVASAEL